MTFQPDVNQELNIGGMPYKVGEHPAARGIPYGQEGRAGTVYQVIAGEDKRALKVFKSRFQVPWLVSLADQIAPFADLPGLQVCRRTVLTALRHRDLLHQYPELNYAVLMPWVEGPTWFEVVLDNKQEFTPDQSLYLAHAFTEILVRMEENRLAHCDLSAPNVLIPALRPGPPISQSTWPVALVDVEQMHGPGLSRPEALPSGSQGYAHHTAPHGLWEPVADRFAGAVLIAEMLGWCDEGVRKARWSESYFQPDEMQQGGVRFRTLVSALREHWGDYPASLFERAWASDTLAVCPTFGEWLLSLPGQAPVIITETPKAAVDASPTSQDETAKATATRFKILLAQAQYEDDKGNMRGALDFYSQAMAIAPYESGVREELDLIVRQIQSQLPVQEPAQPPPSPSPDADATALDERVIDMPVAVPAQPDLSVADMPAIADQTADIAEITATSDPATSVLESTQIDSADDIFTPPLPEPYKPDSVSTISDRSMAPTTPVDTVQAADVAIPLVAEVPVQPDTVAMPATPVEALAEPPVSHVADASSEQGSSADALANSPLLREESVSPLVQAPMAATVSQPVTSQTHYEALTGQPMPVAAQATAAKPARRGLTRVVIPAMIALALLLFGGVGMLLANAFSQGQATPTPTVQARASTPTSDTKAIAARSTAQANTTSTALAIVTIEAQNTAQAQVTSTVQAVATAQAASTEQAASATQAAIGAQLTSTAQAVGAAQGTQAAQTAQAQSTSAAETAAKAQQAVAQQTEQAKTEQAKQALVAQQAEQTKQAIPNQQAVQAQQTEQARQAIASQTAQAQKAVANQTAQVRQTATAQAQATARVVAVQAHQSATALAKAQQDSRQATAQAQAQANAQQTVFAQQTADTEQALTAHNTAVAYQTANAQALSAHATAVAIQTAQAPRVPPTSTPRPAPPVTPTPVPVNQCAGIPPSVHAVVSPSCAARGILRVINGSGFIPGERVAVYTTFPNGTVDNQNDQYPADAQGNVEYRYPISASDSRLGVWVDTMEGVTSHNRALAYFKVLP